MSTTTKRRRMTAEEARRFPKLSVASYAAVIEALEARGGCDCEPYEDVFTFARWRAQGFAVRKGEKAMRVRTWVPIETTDTEAPKGEDGEQPKRPSLKPHTVFLFCRHQVNAKA